MSKYNIGDTVRIASAETINARGRCGGIAGVSAPPGFSWPCTYYMLEQCGTLHEIASNNGGVYRFTDIQCTWEDWMLDDIVPDPEITMPFEEIFKDEPKRIGD